MLVPFAVVALTIQADTLTLPPAAYLERVLADGPAVTASALRARSAAEAARQAGAWLNPDLSVTVDNVGAEREVTGIDGVEGLEGQAVLSFPLPLGGDLAGRRAQGRALADEAAALDRLTRFEAVAAAAVAVAAAQRDRRLAETAREELDALEGLARALGAQAERGRAAEADAARARLESAAAREAWASRRSAAVGSASEVARRAGLPAGEAVRVAAAACRAPEAAAEGGPSPRIEAAEARVRAARGLESVAGAERIPDLRPELGVRRTMGVEALYAGLGLSLPLFDRGGARLQAARAARAAAEAEAEDERRRVEAERVVARETFLALDEARRAFAEPGWEADQRRVVEAARARLELGEGTLTELLDVRRARLRALEARERWAAEWRAARARLAVLEGREPSVELFCDPLVREDR